MLQKILILFLVFISCQKPLDTKSAESPKPNTTFVLIDVSRSMDESNKLREGKAFVSKVSSLLKSNGDLLTVLLVGTNPSIENLYRFRIAVQKEDISGYSEREIRLKQINYQNEVNLEVQKHLVAILKLFKMQRKDESTELLEGLRYISRLPEFSNTVGNRLFIFSDGQENSKQRSIHRLNNTKDEEIIQFAEKDAKIFFPKKELSGIKEVTLQVPKQNQKVSSRDLQIAQLYWEAFFKSQDVPINVTSDIK